MAICPICGDDVPELTIEELIQRHKEDDDFWTSKETYRKMEKLLKEQKHRGTRMNK